MVGIGVILLAAGWFRAYGKTRYAGAYLVSAQVWFVGALAIGAIDYFTPPATLPLMGIWMGITDWVAHAWQYVEYMGVGVAVTVKLTIYSTILGTVFSFAAGLGKLSNHWLIKIPSATFVEIFRGTSLLVQMFWLFYALPIIGHSIGLDMRIPPIIAGVFALSANIGAYGAEVVRGAILAVSKDQYEAAVALNFSPRQTLWKIALRQALPEMMPPFGNLAIQNLKDTSLVSLITIADLAFIAHRLRNLTADSITIYTLVLFMYFFMSLILAFLMSQLAKRIGKWRSANRT